ncbi:hypothetical protein ABEB36_003621 [Hypothenemus hampei]|uniref:THAP-type domain-containing protein n=1 Tax=Hypothenemus hampei TaxID=57062 RepID=A0ABD1F9T5_HYPHA
MRCAVFGCNCDNKSKKNPVSVVKFFHFPKNKDLAKKWLHATGRKDKVNLKNACVCSKRFSESDFKENLQHKLLNYTPARYRGLKEDAIPNKNYLHNLMSKSVHVLCSDKAKRLFFRSRMYFRIKELNRSLSSLTLGKKK